MARVLYITHTGLLDSLGQSQVLQYILGLAAGHRITVLSFEKKAALADPGKVEELAERCRAAGVRWVHRTWHNRPAGLATLYDLLAGTRVALRIAKAERVEIVHCRSYLASLMGWAVKKRTGARLIFDMRGFWPDERVDGGIWRRGGLAYRLFKRLERHLLLTADHVVSLTESGAREISAFPYLQGRALAVSVIPTCTNLDMFRILPSTRSSFTLGYIGSAGSWYMFEHVARTVERLFALRPDARLLVVNKDGHAEIRNHLERAGVDMARVEMHGVPFDQVPHQVARMDAGIFFIKPVWSKRASCPTRMGEFLACGKPVLTNDGVGDVGEILARVQTGIALPVSADGGLAAEHLDSGLARLLDLVAEPGIAERCRAAATAHFALSDGIAKYSSVYAGLAGGKG